MARRWTKEEILRRLKCERGHCAVRTPGRFKQRLAQSLDKRARIE